MESFFSIVKMFAFLLVILYLITISLKYLNRYTNQQNDAFRILKKISVNKSSSIGIVQIMDKCYVMSFSEQQNQILKELTAAETEKLLKQLPQEIKELPNLDFSELLNKAKQQMQQRGKNK